LKKNWDKVELKGIALSLFNHRNNALFQQKANLNGWLIIFSAHQKEYGSTVILLLTTVFPLLQMRQEYLTIPK
jgi:hypothetical protein